MWRFASDDFDKGLSRRPGVACGGLLRTISSRFYLDAPERHVEVCSGRVRKGLAWTIRGSMWRFAPNEFVKVVSNRSGEHVEVCSGRCCKGFIWTILGPVEVCSYELVKVLSGRCRVTCGGLLRTSLWMFYLDDPRWHVEVCSGRVRKGFIWTMRGGMWRFAPDDVVKVLSWRCKAAC